MPVGAETLTMAGHDVLVEREAGVGSGFTDEEYINAGATIVSTAAEDFRSVGDDHQGEGAAAAGACACSGAGRSFSRTSILPPARRSRRDCVESGIVAIAYETIQDRQGRLPCLTPMSEIAGKMSIQEGAKYLEKPMMGRGILLGGVPGVAPAHVVVLGGGIVGTNAAKVAAGLGADVVIMDINLDRLRYLDDVMPANVKTIFSDAFTIREHLRQADLVIGAVLIPGAKAPRLVTPAGSGGDEERQRDRGCRDRPGGMHRDEQANDASAADVSWSKALCIIV